MSLRHPVQTKCLVPLLGWLWPWCWRLAGSLPKWWVEEGHAQSHPKLPRKLLCLACLEVFLFSFFYFCSICLSWFFIFSPACITHLQLSKCSWHKCIACWFFTLSTMCLTTGQENHTCTKVPLGLPKHEVPRAASLCLVSHFTWLQAHRSFRLAPDFFHLVLWLWDLFLFLSLVVYHLLLLL